MASSRKGKVVEPQQSGPELALRFNLSSGAEAAAPNRQQVINSVKGILAKSCNGHTFKTKDGEELCPTENQKGILNAAEHASIVMIDGPFGTGKTIWTAYMALRMLADKKVKKIAVTAPAVEAGEKLGFLPGEANNKMLPYVNQILEAIDDWVGKEIRVNLEKSGVLSIEPHAFLRGRSMKDTFFILDECQNASGPQLMTALSRIGNNSTFVFMGDNRQNDRTAGDSAYVQFMNRFSAPHYGEYVSHVLLGKEDVRRHPFLKLVMEYGDERPLEGFSNHTEIGATHVTRRKSSVDGTNGMGHHAQPN